MYVKFLPNDYVLRYRKGKLIESGAGLSFHCLPAAASAAVVPISAMDADFIFEEKTADYQSVTVQGQLTYRITDYKRIASLMNFSVQLPSKKYYNDPMVKLSKRLLNLADVQIRKRIGTTELTRAVRADRDLAMQILEELRQDDEVKALGVEIMGLSILKVGANNETQRALEARTREEILKGSDDALYERRNASIEQERRVKENELSTEISVEEKKKKIRETEVATKRMLMEKENELQKIKTLSEAEREQIKANADIELTRKMTDAKIEIEKKKKELAELQLENAKKDADAEAYRVRVVMEAYRSLGADVIVALAAMNMDPSKMIASAFEKLAAGSAKIGTLNITPELLESLRKV